MFKNKSIFAVLLEGNELKMGVNKQIENSRKRITTNAVAIRLMKRRLKKLKNY